MYHLYSIYTNITLLFVIVKIGPPRAFLKEEEVQFVQVPIQEHGENIKDWANDPMKAVNDDSDIVEEDEEDGTYRFL